MASLQPTQHQAACAIVILNWNGWQDTLACLESVSQLSHENYTVIVVDNASEDASQQKIPKWKSANGVMKFDAAVTQEELNTVELNFSHQSCIYIQSSTNDGFASGNNIGIQLAIDAGCEYVWLLNNDTEVDPHALDALQRKIKQQHIGMCGSILRYFDARDTVQAIGGVDFNLINASGVQIGQGLSVDEVNLVEFAKHRPTYIAGASMLLSVNFLQEVGLMETSYFLYFEEIDWALRAQPKWKTAIAIDSIVYHKEGASIGTNSRNQRSPLSQYYLNRNLIRFYALRKPYLLPVALMKTSKELLKQMVKRDWALAKVTAQAIFDGIMMKSGKTI